MIDAPVAFAFAAGLVATVNPCGFAMLPAYLGYFMGLDEDGNEPGGIGQGLIVGGVISAGFLTVFGIVGILVVAGLRSVIDYVPWAALVIGVLLVVLGVAMLGFGYQPRVSLPQMGRGASSRRYRSVFAFGASYAVASLSCTLPVFLTVVGAATASANFASGVFTFLVYGAGMSMLVVALTVALGVAKAGLVRRLRSVLPYVSRVSGAILIVAGVYITVYWTANLRDPLAARGATFRFVEEAQVWAGEQLGTRPTFWAVLLGVLLIGAVVRVVWSRWAADTPPNRTDTPPGSAVEAEPRVPEKVSR